MSQTILFDFTVDKEKKEIYVKRMFSAGLPLVWQAWTDAEILDQWWAPYPWKCDTSSMDFREGGRWLYVMRSSESPEKHWCLMNYSTIAYQEHFISDGEFCNEQGEINPDSPTNRWDIQFSSQGEDTMVRVTLSFEKFEHLEQLIQMGFKEGFTLGMDQLDKWLSDKQNAKQ
jgi:PhnB protein